MHWGLDFLTNYQGFSAGLLAWSAYVGVTIAAVCCWLHRNVQGAFVRALLREKAIDDASALSPEETGQKRNFLLTLALRSRRSPLHQLLQSDTPAALPVAKRRYYIPQASQAKAASLYAKKGSGLFSLLAVLLLFLLVTLLCVNFTDEILSLFRSLLA